MEDHRTIFRESNDHGAFDIDGLGNHMAIGSDDV